MLWIINIYFIIGLLFAAYFALAGCSRIDPSAATAKVMVRLMWLPAALVLWPLLLMKVIQANSQTSEAVK